MRRLRLQTDTRPLEGGRRGIAKKGVGSSRMSCRARDTVGCNMRRTRGRKGERESRERGRTELNDARGKGELESEE